ncbi:MAG: putative metal-dependent hydrolase [Sphingomonas bacterium]|uniref:M48 family metallopeptidase n=1 Tax=Sphingomonas bacterium TaxID=1895847 RepID=UPI002638355C|nr:SprT family zinc-dependent metalloprotease [Sphingomonas bacterium]MDB5702901.1 putative metal-dependent hydrolase [Sphingomonas bacterium]
MTGPVAGGVEVVRNARARRAKLSVDPASGRVRLTLPLRAPVKPALLWVEGQQAWIEAQRARLPRPRPFVPGGAIAFGDLVLTIDWREGGPRRIERLGDVLRCGGPRDGLSRRIETWLKREALRILSEETAEFAARAGVGVTKVAVGDPRGRWGSCASSGAIRYSWRLILAPAFVRRSTVAHEVAHRVHMNHGPEFHALVERLDESDPDRSRAWLRANGAALHWVGRES